MGLVSDILRTQAVRSRVGFRSLLEVLHRFDIPLLSLPGGKSHIAVGAFEAEGVLRRPDDFLAGYPKARKLLCQPFILGMDRTDAYLQQRKELEEAVLKLGETLASDLAEREACSVDLEASRGLQVDLVSRFTDRVAYGTIASFLFPPGALAEARSKALDAEPGTPTIAFWARKLGLPVGYARPESLSVERASRLVVEELREYIRKLTASALREAGSAPSRQVFDLLAGGPPADSRGTGACEDYYERVFSRAAGLLASSLALSKALNYSIDEILHRPSVRDEVVRLSRAEDYDALRLYIWEALRFRPAFPVLVRFVPRSTGLVLRSGEVREIPAGSQVSVATCAALFDPELVTRPEVFLPSRFASNPDRLLGFQFGFPERQCLGRELAARALPHFIGALFRQPFIASAGPGRIEWDGLAIDRYWVRGSSAPARALP